MTDTNPIPITESLTSETTDLYHEANRAFGIAVSLDPTELFEQSGEKPLHTLLGSVRDAVQERYQERFDEDMDDHVSTLVAAGLYDTARILSHVLYNHPVKLPRDAVMAILNDPQTIESVARIAQRPQASIDRLIEYRDDQFRIDPTQLHIETHRLLHAESGGCPAAGKESSAEIWPIFRRFVPWAGHIALLSFNKHGLPQNGHKPLL